jgi:hypothetical protein
MQHTANARGRNRFIVSRWNIAMCRKILREHSQEQNFSAFPCAIAEFSCDHPACNSRIVMHNRMNRDEHIRILPEFEFGAGDVSCGVRSASSCSVQLRFGLSASERVPVARLSNLHFPIGARRGCEKIGTDTFPSAVFPGFSPFALGASPIFSQPRSSRNGSSSI